MVFYNGETKRRVEQMNSAMDNVVALFTIRKKLVLFTQVELGWRRVQVIVINDAIDGAN